MYRCLAALLALSCLAPWGARGVAASAASAVVEPALQRFLSRADEPLSEYRALRHFEARNERFNMAGTLDAMTELTPDGHFSYTVLRESGSAYIRDNVLRSVLRSEEKLFATTDPSRAAFTALNYDLEGGEPAEPGVVKLFAKPRRHDVALVDGAVFVTTTDADLLRVEGRLSKNPSFWTTRVDLVKKYDRVAGIRVPVRLDTVAQIRLAGTSTLSVTYDYREINGVTVAP
jgi:hypothetical protein